MYMFDDPKVARLVSLSFAKYRSSARLSSWPSALPRMARRKSGKHAYLRVDKHVRFVDDMTMREC